MPLPLRFYAAAHVQDCHHKAMNLLGLGKRSMVKVPSDDAFRMDLDALEDRIRANRENGERPACVIATAGTTSTGSIDDLSAIADLCAAEWLWLHIDGCIGAQIAHTPDHRHLVAAIERADSLALDLHKGLLAPFDVGCAQVRDRRQRQVTFA